MWERLFGFWDEHVLKYLRPRWDERMLDEPPSPFAIKLESKFWVDGWPDAVQVNIVADYGREWINVTAVKPFGLESSAWKGRAGSKSRHRRKQGLKRQTEKILRGAQQNKVLYQPPRVIVRFTCGVSRQVAEALHEMGAEVEGEIVEPPAPRSERE